MEKIISRLILDDRISCIPCFYLAKIITVLDEILKEDDENVSIQ